MQMKFYALNTFGFNKAITMHKFMPVYIAGSLRKHAYSNI